MRIAVAQAAPVFLDRAVTVKKAGGLIGLVGRHEIALLTFPELFIPAHPDGVWTMPALDENVLNDVAGHYARPDVFQISIQRTPQWMLQSNF